MLPQEGTLFLPCTGHIPSEELSFELSGSSWGGSLLHVVDGGTEAHCTGGRCPAACLVASWEALGPGLSAQLGWSLQGTRDEDGPSGDLVPCPGLKCGLVEAGRQGSLGSAGGGGRPCTGAWWSLSPRSRRCLLSCFQLGGLWGWGRQGRRGPGGGSRLGCGLSPRAQLPQPPRAVSCSFSVARAPPQPSCVPVVAALVTFLRTSLAPCYPEPTSWPPGLGPAPLWSALGLFQDPTVSSCWGGGWALRPRQPPCHAEPCGEPDSTGARPPGLQLLAA